MKIRTFSIILLLLLSIGAASSQENKISPHLIPLLKDKGSIQVIIILKDNAPIGKDGSIVPALKERAEKSQKALMEVLEKEQREGRAGNIESLWITNAIAVNANPELIYSLAARSDVAAVQPVTRMHIVDENSVSPSASPSAIAWGVSKINATVAWQQGINGTGITVAVVDTGVDAQHPALDDLDDIPYTYDPKVIGWKDYINNRPLPYDDDGHGTHVSGIISGTRGTGVAPKTRLIVAKVFDSSGSGTDWNVSLAFQWAVQNKAKIISFSGGGEHSDLMTTAVNNAVNAGVAVVAAAGNEGPDPGTMSFPGADKNAIAVGATDSSDGIASFSSRGPVSWVNDPTYGTQTYIKPDVSAPGVWINSTWPGGGYNTLSGTSMATPHVSGLAALILQKYPGLSPSQLKNKLEDTSIDLGPQGMDNTYGAGRINAYSIFIQTPGPVGITGFAPASPVNDNAGATRAFNITVNQPANVTWTINGAVVQTSTNVLDTKYTNTSAVTGNWNVSAFAWNMNGNAMQTWEWNVVAAPPQVGGLIYGTVYNDLNRNKIRDPGEEGLAGWTISLSYFAGGRLIRATATTNSSGDYSFTNLASGTYTIIESWKSGWAATTPSYVRVSLGTGDVKKVDFGNRRIG